MHATYHPVVCLCDPLPTLLSANPGGLKIKKSTSSIPPHLMQVLFLYSWCFSFPLSFLFSFILHTHTGMHTCPHAHIYTYTYAHLYTYIHAILNTHTHIHIPIHTYAQRQIQTCTHRETHMYMHPYAHTLSPWYTLFISKMSSSKDDLDSKDIHSLYYYGNFFP